MMAHAFRFVEHFLQVHDPKPFPFARFPSITSLCEAVLREFSRKNLCMGSRSVYNKPTLSHPPEAHFQDELYRAFHSLVGHGVGISSEWTRAGDGRIDFRITEPGWGIELLRDGNRLSEHCNRFLPGGAYHRWITEGLLEDWLIIDCRHSSPHPYSMFPEGISCAGSWTLMNCIRCYQFQALACSVWGRLLIHPRPWVQQWSHCSRISSFQLGGFEFGCLHLWISPTRLWLALLSAYPSFSTSAQTVYEKDSGPTVSVVYLTWILAVESDRYFSYIWTWMVLGFPLQLTSDCFPLYSSRKLQRRWPSTCYCYDYRRLSISQDRCLY